MNGTVVTLQYDGDGNRVAKAVGGVTTRYLVDDLNPTGYAQVVEEVVGNAVQRTYTYGRQRISQNQLISSTWTQAFYGYDGGGSVRTLADNTGTVTDTHDYDAWGNAINTTGSTPNVYLYLGEQYDPDLSLYYLRARYLNPLTGRFLTRDPANGRLGDPRTLHKYLYASADPVNRLDPSGRENFIINALIRNRILAGYTALAMIASITLCEIWESTYETTELARLIAEAKESGSKVVPAVRPRLCGLPHTEWPEPPQGPPIDPKAPTGRM